MISLMEKSVDDYGFINYHLKGSTMTEETDYEKQALHFLNSTNTEMLIQFLKYGKHFDNDKEDRNIYSFTLSRNGKTYQSEFGDSIQNTMDGVEPNQYDILACLGSSCPESFEDFCLEYGYDNDSISALHTFEACKAEAIGLKTLFNESELQDLSDIA